MRVQRTLLLVAALSAAVLPASAAIIYVDDTGTDVAGCGTSAVNACRHIQYAFENRAVNNDEIRVMPGTYNECVAAWALALPGPGFPIRAVRIRADAFVNGGNRAATTITGTGVCDQASADPFPTVTLGGNGARLEGFTVTGGGNSGVLGFGGVAITNNIINHNSSVLGGGVYVYSANCYYGATTVTIANNFIDDNFAEAAAGNQGGNGGGIYLIAGTGELVDDPGCLTANTNVSISQNTIRNNNMSGSFGAGLVAFTNTFADATGHTIDVAITNNVITGNAMVPGSAGYGGGIWASTYGAGNESITITGNQVSDNTSTGDGGGISAWVNALGAATHDVLVEDNVVFNNLAEGNGGGLDLFLFATDLESDQHLSLEGRGNEVEDNTSFGLGDLRLGGGGGGILATFLSVRSTAADMHLDVRDNLIRDNLAEVSGGGASLFVNADADADAAGEQGGPARAEIDFSNNLVVGNTAASSVTGAAVGGGVFGLLQSFGAATATLDIDLNTIAENAADDGAGGIHIESLTGFPTADPTPLTEGIAVVNIDSTIIANNTDTPTTSAGAGWGLGGPTPGTAGLLPGGTGNLTVGLSHSVLFGNDAGAIQPTIAPVVTQTDNRTVDPLLVANGPDGVPGNADDYASGLCARIGRDRANGLADANGDDLVDGIDVLRVAVAFGTTLTSPRYDVFADLDGDGLVDGVDLSAVAADFGDTCP